MEDFGYKKTSGQQAFPGAAKRVILACATMFSLAIFIYITISAYYFVHQDKDSDIQTIQSPDGPIKIVAKEKDSGMQVDHAIYEDIFGNKKLAANSKDVKIRAHPEPALPPLKKEVRETKNENSSRQKERRPLVYSSETKAATRDLFNKKYEKRDNTAPAPRQKTRGKRKVRVQIAAMSSREAADQSWQRLNRTYSAIFSGLEPYIERVDLGKRGIFYRLQVGNFPSQIEAEKFCGRYVSQTRKNSADCIIVE